MCGICGFITTRNLYTEEAARHIIRAMTQALAHRGPDGEGFYLGTQPLVALGHRRLSIIDLSAAGHQPMTAQDGDWTISYNGELYNAEELAEPLRQRGLVFRGHSDTEVLVEACAHWGVEATLAKAKGMYAVALHRRSTGQLFLARDPFGIKPLYWLESDGVLAFASEAKAFFKHPAFSPALDPASLSLYFQTGYISSPSSIYRGVKKLEPGTLLTWSPQHGSRMTPFRRIAEIIARGRRLQSGWSEGEAIEALDHALRRAVRRQMVSDVPLGAFLSGGIDSSLIVGLLQSISATPVRTFSVGFDHPGFDETPHAAAVAKHLRTEHTQFYVESGQAVDLLTRLPRYFDEPLADPSAIPTLLLSEMTRRHVTVSLSGDGGDELFAGYTRYAAGSRLYDWVRPLPPWLRLSLGRGLGRLSSTTWDRLLWPLTRPQPGGSPGLKIRKLSEALSEPQLEALRRRVVYNWLPGGELMAEPQAGDHSVEPIPDGVADFAVIEQMQLADLLNYLPENNLAKLDRASMAYGLEGRVPLLDDDVFALAWSFPLAFKQRGSTSKWILREVLARYVPRALFERPKMSFMVPIDDWLRHGLRDWAEHLLAPSQLAASGVLDVGAVRKRWDEHLAGTNNWDFLLWKVLTFQAWHVHWLQGAA